MPTAADILPQTPDGETALWDELRSGRGQPARERLFLLYLPWSRAIAARHFSPVSGQIELADLQQLACVGLLQALDRFDPELGVPFRAYAARRISGSILSGLAKTSEVREQISHRNRARRERLRSLSADAAGAPAKADLLDALVEVAVGLALGFMLEGTALYISDPQADARPGAYESAVWKEAVGRIAAETERLAERERAIVRLHYFENVGFDAIAALLGVSKSRVSQLHRSALDRLRRRLGDRRFALER